MVFSLLRNSLSYFRSFRKYFVAIYAAFLAFPIRELALFFYPEETFLLFTAQLLVVAAIVIAILWASMSTELYLHPEPFSPWAIFRNLQRPIYLSYALYLIPMAFVTVVTWGIPGTIDIDPGRTALYILDGTRYRSVGYSSLFLAAAALVAVAFTIYPFVVLVHLRTQFKDREVRNALKIFALCFGAIAMLLTVINAVSSFGYSLEGIGHLASVALLIAVVRAFRRPTFLKAFLGVVPSLESSPAAMHADQIVLIYRTEEEKFAPLSRYVNEGVSQGNRVIYFYYGADSVIREGLSRYGVDVRHHTLKGNLRVLPLGSLYQTEGVLDEEAAIDTCQELTSEARTLGKKGLRIIIDYVDRTKRPSLKFAKHLTDSRWTTHDHYLHVLMAFTKDAFQGQENALAHVESKIPLLDLSESIDLFSRTVGLSHSEIAGRKILLEYDPISDYERILKSMLVEAASNFERIVVFTRRDSPVYSTIREEPGMKMFIMTSRVSYPQVEKENRVLLPAYDSSLLLDALNKTIEAYTAASFTIIFDNISNYVFTLGPDRAYSLVRQAMELMVSDKITAVFLLNAGTHEQKVVSTFESLFDIELACRSGVRVPEVRRRLGVPVA